MRENEKKLNAADDQKNIGKPVLLAAGVLAVITCCLVLLAVKQPPVIVSIRDFLITLFVFLLFVIGIVLTVIIIILSSKIDGAKVQIDQALSKTDGKAEELAEKITDILRNILNPFIEAKSKRAGILHFFSRKKTEE